MRKTIITKQNIENRIILYDLESLSNYADLEEISFEQMKKGRASRFIAAFKVLAK